MVDALTILASIVFAVLFLAIVAAIVYLGSLPGNIARRRHHPQADAITAASWIGLAFAGVGWPIAFVWAFLRQGPLGAESESGSGTEDPAAGLNADPMAALTQRVAALEQRLNSMKPMNKG
jgi:type VI protein secretion system component VasK